jgi:hypothetical protein
VIRVTWLPTLVLGFLGVPRASADLLSPVGQDRFVTVSAEAVDTAVPASDYDTDGFSASDFGPIDVSRTANASIATASASAGAAQSSQILGDSIRATGDVSGTGTGLDYSAYGQAAAESHCEVTFDVTAPSSFALSGSLAAAGIGVSSVTLEGPSGTVASVDGASNQTTPVSESGPLSPGTYTLVVEASGSAYADFFVFLTASASFDVLLELTRAPTSSEIAPEPHHASPNPFRESTTIRLDRPDVPAVEASVHDVAGRRVRSLPAPSGRQLSWDGRDDSGRIVRPGVYLVRVRLGEDTRVVKVSRVD